MKVATKKFGAAALPPDMPPVDERPRHDVMWPVAAAGPYAGRFQKGQSGNPQGRPPGSRNKITRVIEEMMDEEASSIIRTAIDMAIAGNPRMVKLERLMPALKERAVPLRLPKVERSREVAAASSAVWAAVAEGVLSVIKARMHLEVLATHERTLADAERKARMNQAQDEEDR